jgi:hypothetical protein
MAVHQALREGHTTPDQLAEHAERNGGHVATLVKQTTEEATAA